MARREVRPAARAGATADATREAAAIVSGTRAVAFFSPRGRGGWRCGDAARVRLGADDRGGDGRYAACD